MDLLTPTELLQKYPHVRELWNEWQIGTLLMLKLVRGRKLSRTCIVHPEDVLFYYEIVKKRKG